MIPKNLRAVWAYLLLALSHSAKIIDDVLPVRFIGAPHRHSIFLAFFIALSGVAQLVKLYLCNALYIPGAKAQLTAARVRLITIRYVAQSIYWALLLHRR